MANINALTKQKQLALLGAGLLGVSTVVGAGWYFSTADERAKAAAAQQASPPPDMTGVVDTQFDNKLQQTAVTQFQVQSKEIKEELSGMQQQLAMIARERNADQQRLADLEAENKALKAAMENPATATLPQGALPAPQGTGEPLPAGTPLSQGSLPASGDIPPPTAFYPGMGTPPAGHTMMQPMPPMAPIAPAQAIEATTFTYGDAAANQGPKFPYIPSGSFAEAVVIEGADANAAVTGQQNTSPMQLRITGLVQMPNDHQYDLTGCFVGLEAWGDVSSERAIVRTRSISCKKEGEDIDQKIAGHVSFMGKNGIKGEVVMRNGEILGWAWGAGFVDGIGTGIQSASTPQVGVGATTSISSTDIVKAGIGGGTAQAAKTLSDYYIKRAEQYHPIIPIGAGNEVTLVFQDGFQLETLAEARQKQANQAAQQPAAPLASAAQALAPHMNMGALTAPASDLKVGDLAPPALMPPQ